VLTSVGSGSGRLGGGEGVEAATRDLAGRGQGGSLRAGSFADALVELEVGAAVSAGVLGCFDERPAKLGGAGLGEAAASLVVGRFDHDRVEPGGAHELAGAPEAARVADLGEQVAGEDRSDAPDRLQGAQTSVDAGKTAQLAVELGDFLLEGGDQTQEPLGLRFRVRVEREARDPEATLGGQQPRAGAGPALVTEEGVQPLRPARAVLAEREPQVPLNR